jgi:hypothetical protein
MDLTKLADFLTAKKLMGRAFCDYSENEIIALVTFVIDNYSGRQPCPLLIDQSQRLIVPANADKHQLKTAIRWIQAMIEWEHTTEIMEEIKNEKDIEHVWDAFSKR